MSLRLVTSDVPVRLSEAPPLDFECSWTDRRPDASWVHLAGRLNVASVPELERTLERSRLGARLVVLDLRDITFIDRAGVHAIVNASIRARRAGRRLVLVRGRPHVDSMFRLVGGWHLLEIADLDRGVPPVQVLLAIDDGDLAS
jgi:anti-anti-sigma factor